MLLDVSLVAVSGEGTTNFNVLVATIASHTTPAEDHATGRGAPSLCSASRELLDFQPPLFMGVGVVSEGCGGDSACFVLFREYAEGVGLWPVKETMGGAPRCTLCARALKFQGETGFRMGSFRLGTTPSDCLSRRELW